MKKFIVLFFSLSFCAGFAAESNYQLGIESGSHLNLWSQNPAFGVFFEPAPASWNGASIFFDLFYSRVAHHRHYKSAIHQAHFAPAVNVRLFRWSDFKIGALLGGALYLEHSNLLTGLNLGTKFDWFFSKRFVAGSTVRFHGLESRPDYWTVLLHLGVYFSRDVSDDCQ